ncbi:sensor histidine kinase [Pseudoalteromonas spongiae]|uniref:histidine kinase n=1 Tax=Pseudoalteromonas spongiae TaxID=298657 RepID=A0ABU8EW35_9GAMM
MSKNNAKSMQGQLISLILASVVLATFFAALQSYRSSSKQLMQLFDAQLQEFAEIALALNNSETQTSSAHRLFQITNQHGLVRQSQQLEIDFKTLPRAFGQHLANELPSGFFEAGFGGQRWRLYRLERAPFSVLVAEPLSKRQLASENLLMVSISPVVMVVPIIGLLVFYLVRKNIRPLRALGNALRKKDHTDLTPVASQGMVTELLPVTDKINDLLARLALAFDREKRLTANIAHELRTPISVLSITAHNLSYQLNQKDITQDDLADLKQQVERLAQVVEQIIALSRYTPENFNETLKPIDIESLIQELIAARYDEIISQQQEIELQMSHAVVIGEEFALKTLFDNLLRNAIKYAGKKQRILIRQIPATKNMMGIEVADSGSGVDITIMQDLLTPFYREESKQTKVKGSGLGLAIVKHIVDLLNGKMTLENGELGGLSVKVYLPITDTKEVQ